METPDSPEKSMDNAGASNGQRRLWLYRAAAVIIPLILLFGLPEAAVRLAKPALGRYRSIYFGGDGNSPLVFEKDPWLHWKLRPGVETDFLNVPVRVNKAGFRGEELEDGHRYVMCLGDSSTFGWRVDGELSYPAQLEKSLGPEDRAKRGWRVLNAGVPGYSSFQVRTQAERLLPRWRPEAVIICIGNNEAWPALRSDRSIASSRRFAAFMEGLISKSRFLLWLSEKSNPREPRPFIAGTLAGAEPRVTREEFSDNVRRVIRAARGQGARVILMSPPVNLYVPPFLSRKLQDSKRWLGWCESMTRLTLAGKRTEALKGIEAQLRIDPRNVHALWMKGWVLTQAGRTGEGRNLLEEALERHPFPESCKLSYRRVLERLAREEGIEYVDIDRIFRAARPGKLTADLYLDHCHPTPEGYGLIADALAGMISRVRKDEVYPARDLSRRLPLSTE